MNCSNFARILADFLEARLSPEEQAAARAHSGECDSCRRLMAIADGKVNILSDDLGRELVRSIVEQTSGSACPRVESQLCDFVDGGLDETDSQLVAQHLDYCPECRKVAHELSAMRDVLPELAEIQPDVYFTRSVIEVTSARRQYHPYRRTRFQAWWNQIVQRPRFSFEAAYLGTLILVLAFANPVVPLGNVALRKLGSASSVHVAHEAVLKILPSSWTDGQAGQPRYPQGLIEGAARQGKAALASLDYLLTRGGQMSASSFHWQVRTVASWSRQARESLRGLWSYVSKRFLPGSPQPS